MKTPLLTLALSSCMTLVGAELHIASNGKAGLRIAIPTAPTPVER